MAHVKLLTTSFPSLTSFSRIKLCSQKNIEFFFITGVKDVIEFITFLSENKCFWQQNVCKRLEMDQRRMNK